MLLVCDDHVELAIDIIVDEHERAPEVLTLAQAGLDDAAAPKCERCASPAVYVVR